MSRNKKIKDEESLKWWNNKIKKYVPKDKDPSDYKKMNRRRIGVGSMVVYKYNPKFRDVLPFFDERPIVIFFNNFGNKFLGCNLHYIHPKFREVFLSKVIQLNKFNIKKDRRFKLAWEDIKEFIKRNGLEISIRMYLKPRMSDVQYIPGDEWKYASSLPSEKFVLNGKMTADQLYAMIRSHTKKTKASKNKRYGR